MQYLLIITMVSASAASNHCSAPIWEGGSLLSTEESCQRRELKGSWCQKNPSNCATCSGIWCTAQIADDSPKDGKKQDATKSTVSTQIPVDESPISPSTEVSDEQDKKDEGNNPKDLDTSSSSVCTGRPELDALLERSKIAQVSKITDSDVYTWSGFCRAIRMMDDSGLPLELGTRDAEDELAIGAANIASLLAQTMWESGGDAPFSACDENNYTGKTDAACTQRYDGQRYDSLVSSSSCKVDPQMVMTAETYASWTPGPMQCAPGTITEGCCWWGRGAIQTTGPHNYAQLQRDVISKLSQFANVDLCTNPEAICQVDELKWLGALYYWTTVVQREVHFPCSLKKFVQSSFDLSASRVGGANFATGCGGSVNNGYWASTPHGNTGRLRYFNSLMKAMRDNGLAAPAAGKDIDAPCALTNQENGGSHSTAVCAQCSGAENCYVHGWAVPCMETTKDFCSSTHNAVWCGATSNNVDSNVDSATEEENDKAIVTEGANDLDTSENKNDSSQEIADESHVKDVCEQCSGSENCYVHGWAVPCMETTKVFCSDTPNSVWCSSIENEDLHAEIVTRENSKAFVSPSPEEKNKHGDVTKNGNDAPIAEGPCVTFMTDVHTGHCQTFLQEAANRLAVSISEITSFESVKSGVPSCSKGADGSFASSQGGLWAGIAYKVCIDDSEQEKDVQHLESKSSRNEVAIIHAKASESTNLRKSEPKHEYHGNGQAIHEGEVAETISDIVGHVSTTSETVRVANEKDDEGNEASFSLESRSQNIRHSSSAPKNVNCSWLGSILSVVALVWTTTFKGYVVV